MFTVKALGKGKLDIHLASSYMHDLKLMIVNSDNDAAGRCIHGLGFAYLNGALEDGGFFNSKDKKGVWAAGDFHHGWTPVRIPCGNLARRDRTGRYHRNDGPTYGRDCAGRCIRQHKPGQDD